MHLLSPFCQSVNSVLSFVSLFPFAFCIRVLKINYLLWLCMNYLHILISYQKIFKYYHDMFSALSHILLGNKYEQRLDESNLSYYSSVYIHLYNICMCYSYICTYQVKIYSYKSKTEDIYCLKCCQWKEKWDLYLGSTVPLQEITVF